MSFALLRRFWLVVLVLLTLVGASGAMLLQARRFAAQTPVYALDVGQKLTYAVGYGNAINADFAGLMPPPKGDGGAAPPAMTGMQQTVQSRLSGKWVAIVVEQSESGRVFACHLEDADISLRSGEAELREEAAQIKRDLERPFWVSVSPQGLVREVRFDAQTPNTARGFARALLGWWQFVTPETVLSKGEQSWEATESDPAGRYRARYALADDDKTAADADNAGADDAEADDATQAKAGIAREAGTLFSKTKLRYLPSATATATEAAPANQVAAEARLLARFDRGALQALRGWENQTISLAERKVANSQTNVAFRLMERVRVGEATLQTLQTENVSSRKTDEAEPLFVAPDADEMREATRQSTLGDDSLGSLLSQLAAAQKSGQTETVALYVKFRALAEVRPESCEILGQLLSIAPPQSLTFRVISEALSAAKSDAAQAALVEATRGRKTDGAALQNLIPALSLSANPSQEAQDLLSELARSNSDAGIASTAQLALGNLARSLQSEAPARSEQIVDDLTAQLKAARSDVERQQLLLTLGNTGSARALAALREYSRSSNVALRATAVNSLRFVAGADAEKLLLQALAGDASAEVRFQAAQALNFRPMNDAIFAASQSALLGDADQNVRLALLNSLWSANNRRPEVAALVARVARDDASTDVKKAATELLARSQNGGAAP